MSSVKAVTTHPQVARDLSMSLGARSSIARSRRMETLFAASLSTGAAVIHFAVASSHLESLGDLALGFYWAALFQAAFAVALLTHPFSRLVAHTGIAINLVLIGAWAWSRTVGLPAIPGGPESVGLADATTVAFQVVLVWLLAARLVGLGTSPMHVRPAASLATIADAVLVVGVGLVVLSTTIAVNDGLTGHGHDRAAPQAHPENEPALIEPGPIPHGHGAATAH